ncbi:hypothetical protein DV738_g3367, partial [Chaetothyriales sp. CBS 135597]
MYSTVRVTARAKPLQGRRLGVTRLALFDKAKFAQGFSVLVANVQMIVGAGSFSSEGPQPLRYEINTFSQSGPAWDLYVQALSELQARNEQAIWQAAQTIAQSYPDDSRSTYTEAAENLRIPYWDAVAYPWLPDVTTAPFLQINTPSGQQSVNNPLLSYTFQRSPSENNFPEGGRLSNFPATVRHWDGSKSNQSAVTASLQASAASNLALTYSFFTTVSDWFTFSTTAVIPGQTSSSGTNIENVHNNIHGSIGGYGHMSDPTVAGFDPIFWLHHTNIDRQLALWQALYPDSYVEPAVNNYGSSYIIRGSTDTITTPLAPFHDTDDGSSMWTSDGVRSLATFRYSYPELPYWSLSREELQANVRNAVNQLYNPGSAAQRKRSTVKSARRTSSLAEAFSSFSFEQLQALGINKAGRQWFARLRLEKYAADTAFNVLAFIGEPPEDPSEWSSAPNLAGSFTQFIPINSSDLFANGPPTGQTEGEISLTHAVLTGIDRGIIATLLPDVVVPLLQVVLQWRVQAADGSVIDINSLTDLNIKSSFTIECLCRPTPNRLQNNEFDTGPDMRSKSRKSLASPAPVVHLKAADLSVIKVLVGDASNPSSMSQTNGLSREQSPLNPQRVPSGRVASIGRSGTRASQASEAGNKNYTVHSSPSPSPQPEQAQWSSAIGHASTTGKSGRVIERLQTDIDRLHREAHVLKMRHDEVEKTNDTLVTRNQYLQDRNNNYEQSHEATLRQLARKERQVEDLREELAREKERTSRAQEQARAASASEGEWREQANKAKALASQREAEYEVIASCRSKEYDRHQLGLDKVKDQFGELMRQKAEDREKVKKLELLAEYQRETITQLDGLNKRMNANFVTYRNEMDSAVADMRRIAGENDVVIKQKLAEMQETIDKMRWVMQVDQVVNHNEHRPQTSVNAPPPPAVPSQQPPSQQQLADSEMATSSRNLFFSSPYAFNPIGVTEFLERFKNGLESQDDAVFVAYDDRTHLFSMTVDRSDTKTAPYFLAQLKVFTDQHVKYGDVLEPRIYHKQEPTPRQPVHHGTQGVPDLLDLNDSENSDYGEEDALQGMNHVTDYWCPKDGDIKILTTSVAENIASLTRSAVYPEAQASQVRLVGGDFGAALRKLQNMEALLALQHGQRLQKTASANANILLLTADDPNPSMRFWPISDPEKASFSRVMVESRAAYDLDHKYVCEKFVVDETGTRQTPATLKEHNLLETREIGQSRIWADYVYKSIGDESNMEPQLAPDLAPAAGKSQASPPASVPGTTVFLEPVKAAQVAAWSGQIDELTDPYTAKPAPPEDSIQEKTGDNTISLPFAWEKKSDDLISIAATQPVGSAHSQDMVSGAGTGLSIFEGDGALEFTETATVVSNLLDQNSEIAPPSQPAHKPIITPKTPMQNAATNPFSILGSDHDYSGPDALLAESSTETKPRRLETFPSRNLIPVGDCPELFSTVDAASEGWKVVTGSKPNSSITPTKLQTLDDAFCDNLSNHFEPAQMLPAQGSQVNFEQWAQSKDYENHVVYRPNIQAQKRAALEKLMASRGQAMLTPGGDEIYRDKPISTRNWDKMLGIPRPNGPRTVFSNMLTANGTDIDRILEAKLKGSKMWEQAKLSQHKVTYEFHCQSKQGLDFWLVVNEDGSYSVRNERTTIGMVAMHYPVRVWDAAAVLKGQEIWEQPPQAIADAIEELVNSIYILPGRRQLALTFRQPKNLEITVRKVVLKRISMHQCGIFDCEHLYLQVSEVKALATKIHPNDRRLWQAFEKEYHEMVIDNAVHYKLSIVDDIINDGFEANKELEVGELTSASCTGAKLLKDESISKLIELTALMLSKMDWVGAGNTGTQLRWAMDQQKQARQQQQSLPPTARSRMQQSILPASLAASRVGGSMLAGGSGDYTYVGMADIPGPRAKTNAPVYVDSGGNWFALGMGGAYVPIPDAARSDMVWQGGVGLSTIGEEVGPDDSASQYGFQGGVRAPPGLSRWGVASSIDRSRGPGYGQSKGPGFW